MAYTYVDLDWVDINLKCCKKDLRYFKYLKKTDNFRNLITLTITAIPFKKNNKKWVSIKALISDKYYNVVDEPIFYICIPYLKNVNYSIKYKDIRNLQYITKDFSADNSYDISTKNKFTFKSDNLEITKWLDPNFAKKKFKYLQKNNLIGKIFWDKIDNEYDITCHTCKYPTDDCYMALSCPSIGFVELKKEHIAYNIENNLLKEGFTYNKNLYKKTPSKEWTFLTYWNEKEYENIRHSYITLDERAWVEDGKLDNIEYSKSVKSANAEWPEFNSLWQNTDQLYRPIGSVSPKEIYNSNDIKRFKNIKFEKVLTKGWHCTQNPNLVPCPVCEDLYDIARSYDIYGKFRSLLLRAKNMLYTLRNPYIIKNKICKSLSLKFKNKTFGHWKNGLQEI